MAKAILGHVGGPDPRMLAEMRRMQRRIAELESELMRVRVENDALSAQLHNELVADLEPALT